MTKQNMPRYETPPGEMNRNNGIDFIKHKTIDENISSKIVGP